MDNEKIQLAFAAIDKSIEDSIPSYEEKKNNKGYVVIGDGDFENYLYELYTTVVTLRSIISTTSDFVVGEGVNVNVQGITDNIINKTGMEAYELVQLLVKDLLIYGNAYCQIIRNKAGVPSEMYWLSARYVRSDEKNNLFYYNKDFAKKKSGYLRSSKTIVYPKFNKDSKDSASVVMLKTDNDSTYGLPLWIAALKDAETERQLSEFNLSQLENSFFSSYLIGFNNGIPDDSTKSEIEKNINEKFCGSSNAGRVLISFSNSKDNAPELHKFEIDNFAQKFNTTSLRASKKLYESFGAQSVLFGVEKETTGFNSEDYKNAFKLYSRLRIRPLQVKMENLFKKVWGGDEPITIEPFKIDWSDEGDNNKNIETVE